MWIDVTVKDKEWLESLLWGLPEEASVLLGTVSEFLLSVDSRYMNFGSLVSFSKAFLSLRILSPKTFSFFIGLHCHNSSVPCIQGLSRSWRPGVGVQERVRLGLHQLYAPAIFLMKLPLSLVRWGFIYPVRFHKRIDFCHRFEGLYFFLRLDGLNFWLILCKISFLFICEYEQRVNMFYYHLSGCFCLMMLTPFYLIRDLVLSKQSCRFYYSCTEMLFHSIPWTDE